MSSSRYGISTGWAYEGKTYSKGAPIWFVSVDKQSLKDFLSQFFYFQDEKQVKNEEERQSYIKELFEIFPEVFTVYPDEGIGKIDERLPNGSIIFKVDVPDVRKGKGYWTYKYIRVSPSRIKRMPNYVY